MNNRKEQLKIEEFCSNKQTVLSVLVLTPLEIQIIYSNDEELKQFWYNTCNYSGSTQCLDLMEKFYSGDVLAVFCNDFQIKNNNISFIARKIEEYCSSINNIDFYRLFYKLEQENQQKILQNFSLSFILKIINNSPSQILVNDILLNRVLPSNIVINIFKEFNQTHFLNFSDCCYILNKQNLSYQTFIDNLEVIKTLSHVNFDEIVNSLTIYNKEQRETIKLLAQF